VFDFYLLIKLKNSLRRGLFHPDDIKTIGLAPVGSGPMSAPLPSLSRKSSRPSISPRGTLGSSSGSGVVTPVSTSSGHHRSNSFANGSLGKADFQKQQAEFGKYAEDDEEDYEDVFGKPNASCEYANLCLACLCGAPSGLLFRCSRHLWSLSQNTQLIICICQLPGSQCRRYN
jgi:hypothetical protein